MTTTCPVNVYTVTTIDDEGTYRWSGKVIARSFDEAVVKVRGYMRELYPGGFTDIDIAEVKLEHRKARW